MLWKLFKIYYHYVIVVEIGSHTVLPMYSISLI